MSLRTNELHDGTPWQGGWRVCWMQVDILLAVALVLQARMAQLAYTPVSQQKRTLCL
jgi:hypothetical protein